MLGIAFTTIEEAGEFVSRYERGRFSDLQEDTPMQDDHVLVTVTGTGKIKATLHTERLLRTHDLDALIHTGTCTALDETIEIGSLFGVAFVLEGDRVELSAPSYPRMPLDVPFDTDVEGTLVTQDHAMDDDETRSYWQRIADATDTTSYPIAYVAAQHGVACHVAKVVTGHAGVVNENFQSDRQAAYDDVAAFLLDRVDERVSE